MKNLIKEQQKALYRDPTNPQRIVAHKPFMAIDMELVKQGVPVEKAYRMFSPEELSVGPYREGISQPKVTPQQKVNATQESSVVNIEDQAKAEWFDMRNAIYKEADKLSKDDRDGFLSVLEDQPVEKRSALIKNMIEKKKSAIDFGIIQDDGVLIPSKSDLDMIEEWNKWQSRTLEKIRPQGRPVRIVPEKIETEVPEMLINKTIE